MVKWNKVTIGRMPRAFIATSVIAGGGLGLALYGIVATFQPPANFGRVFAAYGGIFIVGSILWGMAFEGFRPDRWDVAGAAICLVGMAVIMYAPRP